MKKYDKAKIMWRVLKKQGKKSINKNANFQANMLRSDMSLDEFIKKTRR